MSAQVATPVNQTPRTIVSDAPAGSWEHPRLEEINRRLNATTFGERQIKSIIRNVLLILTLIAVREALSFDLLNPVKHLLESTQPFLLVGICGILLLVAWNIGVALYPLYGGKDDLSDVPLTPTQRALLGLGPASHPATPGSHYITPPRYSRSSTPRSRSASGSPYSESPLSGYGATATGTSPSASPLFQKAMGRDRRRISHGTPSPLSLNRSTEHLAGSLMPNVSKSIARKDVSVSLPSRWIYERGKSSPSTLRNGYL